MTLTLLIIGALSLNQVIAWEKRSECYAHTGSSCEHTCNEYSNRWHQCNYKDWKGYFVCKVCICECYDFDACKWCGDCNPDWCIEENTISGDCNFEEVVKLPGICSINKLEQVDEEIGKQTAWNLGGVLADALGISTIYAIYDPVGPVTSPFQLNNALRTEINDKIKELQSCMDSKISNTLINEVWDADLTSALTRFDGARGAVGTEYEADINYLFDEFRGDIAGIFDNTKHRTYWEYESMLPMYQAFLSTLFIPVANDQLKIQRTKSDRQCQNYYNTVNNVKTTLSTFQGWILKARESIKASLTPPSYDNNCQIIRNNNPGGIKTNNNAFSGECKHGNGIMFCDPAHSTDHKWKIKALMSSQERNKICNFNFKGRGSDWTHLDYVRVENARICKALTKFDQMYRQPVMNKIPAWTESFTKKYIDNLQKYIANLQNPEPCVEPTNN